MATVTRLAMSFTKSNGDPVTMSYNYAKPTATNAQIKALMQGIITNGSIFKNVPAYIKSAEFITTDKTAIDLS